MNKRILLIIGLIFGGLFLLGNPTLSFAASDVYVDPSSGSYSENFSVDLSINTNGDAINGVEVDLDFSGPVTYVNTVSGDIGCTPSVDEVVYGSLSVICFIAPGSEFNGEGVIGTIFFSLTGNGSVTVEPSYVDIAGSTVGDMSGGNYTVSQTSTTTTSTSSTSSTTSTSLPSSTTTTSSSSTSTTIVLEPTTTSTTAEYTTTTLANSTTTSVYTPTTVITTTTAGSSSSTLPDTARLNFSNPVVWFSVLIIVGCILFGVNFNGSSRIKKSKSSSSTESMRSKI